MWPATHGFISVSEVYLVVCVLGELYSSLCIELWDFDVVGLLSNRCHQLQLPVPSQVNLVLLLLKNHVTKLA